ncbi:hypothetical protein H0W91_02290 [Patescibacteria group bacterium]|nr:hypothetical protein [Patescibacteria group bacterium]
MEDIDKITKLLEKLTGKKVVEARTDGSNITLVLEGNLELIIDRSCYEDGVPDNS